MSMFDKVRTYLARRRTMRERWNTERMIESLPADVRKDIGWPGFYPGDGWRAGNGR